MQGITSSSPGMKRKRLKGMRMQVHDNGVGEKDGDNATNATMETRKQQTQQKI
jgi:hypothetical protein